MKLHLNLSLRRALLAALAVVSTLSTSRAGVMHDDVRLQTYTDFGQNRGRYVVGSRVNALVEHIRQKDGGITIEYTDGTPTYTISNTQGMISFNGTHDGGHATVIGPNFIATVEHNGGINGSFSERTVGKDHAINYEAIDINNTTEFRLVPAWGNDKYDYMLQRQSKVVTDVTWNPLTTLTNEQVEALDGTHLYHSGSGTQCLWNEEQGRMEKLTGAYAYIIGSINSITNGQVHPGADNNISLHQQPGYGEAGYSGASEAYPLPNGIRAGDSGSPTFIYNTATGQYEYIAAQQSGGGNSYGQARGNIVWTAETLKAFDAAVNMGSTSTVYLNAITGTGETITDGSHSTTLHYGLATDAAGNELGRYNGVQTGTNTWGDLSYLKDKSNWYAFENRTNDFFNPTVISDLKVSDADLFYTQNLVFTPSQAQNNIILNATVDLGIGYAEFNKGADMEKAVFNITAADGTAAMFNHAGYVVNEGAEVHVQLNNSTTHMTEWRKVGAGDLYIDGTGDTNALLNLGGSGTTYLQQSGGHAAYNVLASSGAKVVISSINQIERDFTFGAGGGTLDLNGNSMDWYTSSDADGRFTINALTEEAIITNSSRTGNLVQSTLTYKQSGNTTYAGSFQDSATGTLQIVYDAGENSTWTLNSIHTDISHNSSGFTVNSGKVILSGTNTVHGLGSATGTNATRYTNADDWHYADARMNVEVADGATFELGSHARLQGSVYLYDGGTFIIREGVKHQYEYVEGGATLEDTYQYAEYYGYKGINTTNDIYLGGTRAALKIQYSEGTTANTTLGASISGGGAVSVDAGTTGGTLTLSGSNGSMSGTKTLISGGLIATTATALGNTDTNKWVVQEKGWIASTAESGSALLARVDSSSTGVLALSADTGSQLDLSRHQGLYIGAEHGKTVNYGTADDTLAANAEGNWLLGGGGGTLNVHFLLTGGNNLVVGNEYSSGTVHLTNLGNDFTGNIFIMGTGNILTYEIDTTTGASALGNARVSLSYGNALALHSNGELSMLSKEDSKGSIAATRSMDLDMTGYSVALGAAGDLTFTGTLTVGDRYRLGGSGHLTLDTALDGAKPMEIDGQGTSGSSVTLARENAYTGDITAGGALQADAAAGSGSIAIHAGHENSFAQVNSLLLKQGAVLYTDGNNLTVRNLSAEAGASLQNNGNTASRLNLEVTQGTTTSIANGVLSDSANTAGLTLVKTGTGTLEMEANTAWSGGLIIEEGRVAVSAANGGTGSGENTILINPSGTLQVTANQVTYGNLGQTILNQKLTGTGTIEIASGGNMLLTQQAAGFEGTVHVTGNTRLYVGKGLTYNKTSDASFNNAEAFDNATIRVDSGSQVRITNNLVHVSTASVTSDADYIIAGTGKSGVASPGNGETKLVHEDLTTGALSIDCGAILTGNVTLAENATIASSSKNPTTDVYRSSTQNIYTRYYSIDNGTPELSGHYGVVNHLGGTIRGIISGEGKTLTIAGNESMTFTADSANTYGGLVIANANGSNDDKFALRLDGGKSMSQTSTALGLGQVTLNDGLILRLAGTGTADNTNVVYTYANAIAAGQGATLQSHNITNRLTGTVSMSGTELNLATAHGGVLELAGGISGSGTVNLAADARVILGGSGTFSGTISAEAGADLRLCSPAALSAAGTITGSNTLHLHLHLGGTADYTLGGISLTPAGEETATTLNLSFDFTGIPDAAQADTWSTLSSSISAGSTVIELELNMFNDLRKGEYTLLTQAGSTTSYTLGDSMNGRLSLSTNEAGALVLSVGNDQRLFWRSGGDGTWAGTNWYSDEAAGKTTYTSGKDIMLNAEGVASTDSRETITLDSSQTTGSIGAQQAAYEIAGPGSLSGTRLTVGNKGDLKLSNSGGNSFSDGVLVNDAALEVSSNMTAGITAENGGSYTQSGGTLTGNISLNDASATIRNATLAGNAQITGSTISIEDSTLQGRITTAELGSGGILGSFDGNGNATYAAGSLVLTHHGSSGTSLNLAKGTLSFDSAMTIDSLALGSNTTAILRNTGETDGSAKHLRHLELGNNATLSIDNRINKTSDSAIIDALTVEGSATIKEIYGSGYLKVGTLHTTGERSTLNLTKESSLNGASYTAIFELGSATAEAGNFKGDVVLSNTRANNNNHSVFITLAGKDTLANAVVKMNTQASTNAYLGLGIMADNATIAGLESSAGVGRNALLFSGESKQDCGWNRGDETNNAYNLQNSVLRTLRIDTAANTEYTYNGRVLSNLNIVKTGEGTQAFQGSSTGYGGQNFNGSISVDAGKLVIGAAARGMLESATGLTVGDATLDLSGISFGSTGGILLSNGATFSFGDNAILDFGSLEANTTYSIFDLSAGGQLSGWDSLTIDNFYLNGMSLADSGRTEIQIGQHGTFQYIVESMELTWNGGSTGTWNQGSENKVWQQTDPFLGTSDAPFVNHDNAIFTGAATATLGSDILVSRVDVQAGTVVIKDPGTYAFRANRVNVADAAHLQLRYVNGAGGENTSISSLVLGEGATLSTHDEQETTKATRIGTLQLDGARGTLKDAWNSGYFAVDTLNMGPGLSSSMLKLEKHAASSKATLFEFGSATAAAGNFAGEVELRGHASGGKRSAFIIISGAEALAGAHIDLAATNCDTAFLGLGINTANATIAGLESGTGIGNRAKLFSGTIGTQTEWYQGGNTPGTVSDAVRSLTINTAEGSSYTFNGEVVGSNKLNLVKDGEGAQAFNGSGSFKSITVNGGTLTLGGTMGMSESTTYNVAANAVLNFNSSTAFSSDSKLTKDGAGKMVIGSRTNLTNMLETKGGEVVLAYTGTDGNTINKLDGAMTWGTTAQGTLRLAENVKLTISNNIWTRANTGILLEKGAELNLGSYNLAIRNEDADEARFGADSTSGQEYNRTQTGYEIRHARVINTANGDASLSNKLVNSTVENKGNGTFTLNHSENSLSGVVASGGNVTLQSMGEAMSLNLLEIAAGKVVNACVGTNVDESSTVTVTGSALLSGTATLNASLTLAEGATLDMTALDTGAVTLNGALTFGGKVTMDKNLLAIVSEMSGWEESLTLFTGLSGVTLPGVADATGDGKVLATEVFTNVTNPQLYVTYQVIDNVGSLMVVHVPEPATATLSLLALAALAARRRRKE